LEEKQYLQEDEIDLRELVLKLWDKKLFIILFTGFVTLSSICYSLVKTPIYKASAMIEIGNYKTQVNDINGTLLGDEKTISEKLNMIFDKKNKDENPRSYMELIETSKGKGLIKVVSFGLSNNLAVKKIREVLSYMNHEDKEALDRLKFDKQLLMKQVNCQINTIKNTNKVFEYMISLREKRLEKLQMTLTNFGGKSKLIEKLDSSSRLSEIIGSIRVLSISYQLDKINESIYELRIKYQENISKLDTLEDQKERYKFLLLPKNYQNTQIVGKILTDKYPAKPKKKLIIIIAFFTSFILSIFLVFFIEFIKSFKNEEKA